jgi:uncharacterized protein (TIGR02646 family)
MRRVVITGEPAEAWKKDAEALTKELRAAKTKAERDKIIEDHEGQWKKDAIRNWLLDQFHRKCWYTEAQESVSAYHVDHFRPKGRVTDGATVRDGYWWLAFDWHNYRICGQLINTKKKDHFPLEDGRPADENSDLRLENYQVLDPTEPDDVCLVSFEKNGEVVYSTDISDTDKTRVDKTIDVLGLNRLENLNRKRSEKWRECQNEILSYNSSKDLPSSYKKLTRAMAVTRLKAMVKYEAEFSSVVLACLHKEAPESLYRQIIT